jgi:hypothetical protein
MADVFIYLVKTLFFRIVQFFRRWYGGGFFAVYGQVLRIMRAVLGSLDPRLNLRFLFHPLYQERNVVGYLLGFLVRGSRALAGGVLSLVLLLCGAGAYVLWALIPVAIMYKVITG